MATKICIQEQVGKLSTVLRHPLTPSEFEVVADEWCDIFYAVPDAVFEQVVRVYLTKSRYFPAPADVLEIIQLLHEEHMRKMAHRAFPEIPTGDELERNRLRANQLLESFQMGVTQ